LQDISEPGELGRSWLLLAFDANLTADPFFWTCGVLITIFIFLSAFVSASEVAFFSIDQAQLRILEKSERSKDKMIREFLKKPRRLLASILIYNTLFNVASVALLYYVFASIVADPDSNTWQILLTAITALIVIFFGEVLPKQYASHNNIRVARLTVMPLRVILFLFLPLVRPLVAISDFINRQLQKMQKTGTSVNIQQAIDIAAGKEEGTRDTRMLKRIVNFGNITVTEIMQSRMDVLAIDESAKYDELLEVVRESGYSRIPVYRKDYDHVMGIMYTKDLLKYIGSPPDFAWQQLVRAPFFVPESKKIDSLLEEFRYKRIHMAIVIDEYGGSSGLVTLEDVLEEVTGEIKDEFDDLHEIEFKRIDKHNYIFEGKTQLIDFCNILDIPADTFDEVRGEGDSLAGLMLELRNEMPNTGDIIEYGQYQFKVLTVNKARISRIRVTILSQEKQSQ